MPAANVQSAARARLHQARLQFHVLWGNPLQKGALIFIAFLVVVAIVGSFTVPDMDSVGFTVYEDRILQPPSWAHPFGTDEFGRDMLSRVMYGARISLSAAAMTVAIAVGLGASIGVMAAGFGGHIDEVLMRIVDIFLSFPVVVLAIVIAAYWGGSLQNAILALGLTWWPFYARLVRGTAVSVRERPYVRAAEANGTPKMKIIFRHILPSPIGPTLVTASLDFGFVILSLAALSFLGVGAQAPLPEWGLLINQSREYFLQAWWYMAFPGLAITVTVLAFNLIGDGLGEVVNPKTRGRG